MHADARRWGLGLRSSASLVLLVLLVLSVSGCTRQQAADNLAGSAKGAKAASAAADSAPAKAAAALAGPAGETVRLGIKWGAEGWAALATLAAAYLGKKAVTRKRKERTLRQNMTKEQRLKADSEIYGKKFKAELSK